MWQDMIGNGAKTKYQLTKAKIMHRRINLKTYENIIFCYNKTLITLMNHLSLFIYFCIKKP